MAQKESQQIDPKISLGAPGNILSAQYFYFDTAPFEHTDLAIVCGGYEKCAADFDINRRHYPYYFIKYTVQGRGELLIKGNKIALTPGTLTGFAPGTAHHYQASRENPMEHYFITFLGQGALDLLGLGSLATNHVISVPNPEAVLVHMEQILQTGTDKPEHAHALCCLYLRTLLMEIDSDRSSEKGSLSAPQETFRLCKSYIDKNFSSIKSPKDAAAACCVEVRHMSVLFKKYSHLPPRQYISQLKLNKAANLLLSTALSIQQVALEVGYDDPFHFSKNFKQFHGSSPQAYRQAHLP